MANAWHQANRAHLAAYKRKRRLEGKEKPRDPQYFTKRHLQKKYNMTVEEHAALLIKQEGRCAICRIALERTNVDHDHNTGKVRGILCPSCNMALGLFQDSTAVLQAAKDYLDGI
jgi:recombination endonuclease VII